MLDRPLVQPREPAHDLAGFMPFNGAPLARGQAGQTAEAACLDPPQPSRGLTMGQKLFSCLKDDCFEYLAEQALDAVDCA